MTVCSYTPTPGTVYFIGAGPGASDLITVRGQDIIAQADLILYADSLVEESVAHLARKPDARIIGTSNMHLEQVLEPMIATARAGGVVARVHSGDPALYGATQEQMAYLDDANVPYEIVPGVTAAFAAAARLGVELTVPEVVQTIILTRAAGRTPMPPGEDLRGLAAHGASLAIYLSVRRIGPVVDDLLRSGAYTPETPVAVLHRVTWPDESLVLGTLADIVAKVKAAGYTRQALILVSPALNPTLKSAEGRKVSNLYDKTYTHRFRRAVAEVPAYAGIRRSPHLQGTTADSEPQPLDNRQQTTTGAADSAVIAVTREGTRLAARLAQELDAELVVPERFVEDAHHVVQPPVTVSPYTASVLAEIQRRWSRHRRLVLVLSTGIAVRALAPLLGHKSHDPAVVCLDEAGRSVIPLLGGHQAGANALARRIATVTGGHAAITTASDTQGKPALDLLGQDAGWRIDPASALTHASAALVNGDLIGVYVDPALLDVAPVRAALDQADNLTPVGDLDELELADYTAGLIVSHRLLADTHQHLLQKCVLYRPPVLVAGMGCRRDVPAAELRAALETTLADAGLAQMSVAALATADLKADEPGLRDLAASLDVPLHSVERAHLAALDPAAFSASAAQEKFDLPGVAEPCAVLASGGGTLLVPKRSFERCTVAVALRRPTVDDEPRTTGPRAGGDEPRVPAQAGTGPRAGGDGQQARDHRHASLALVSIGPGDPQQMTVAAREALQAADVVIGYEGYIGHVRALLQPHQEVIARTMKSEMERAAQAVDLARAGQRVALISSGDIGIYAMAGPVFEVLRQHGWDGTHPAVEVFPGVSAVQAAAARLGAAISHDFCTISLSDLLTPWEVIERRLWAAARGDFVVGIYNPRSRERHWQLGRALEIFRTYRPATTPAAVVRNVTRPDETITLTTLANLDPAQVDMFSLVLVGNSQSYIVGGRLATPRGYTAAREVRYDEQGAGTVASEPDPQLQTPAAYPIILTQLRGAHVVIVGGGPVGERKARGLLAVGAAVRLISPEATPQLRAWAAQGRLHWEQRPYRPGELAAGARPALVFAATDQREVNAQVAREAQALKLLCNVADRPDEGTFYLPAVHRQAGVTIAVSTDGASPARARQVRDTIAAWLSRNESVA